MTKVSELQGADLDYWVARAEGYVMERVQDGQMVRGDEHIIVGPQSEETRRYQYSPSTVWSQGGPIIEKYNVWLHGPRPSSAFCTGNWQASLESRTFPEAGPTPLIAAMRAVVSSVYGQEVEHGRDS